MKKRLGFTLVELLAVIAILSLLVIIALPNIVSLFKEAKKNSYETELKNIYKAAQQQWMSDSMFDTQEIVYSNCEGCNGKKLSLSGRGELQYYIKIGKSGDVVEYCSTDNTYQYLYNGNKLLVTEINSSEEVADTDPNLEVVISNAGCERKGIGRAITVCYYYNDMSTLTNERVGPMRTKDCTTKQTVTECLGTGVLGMSYSTLYSTNMSNNGSTAAFDACLASINAGVNVNSSSIMECFNKAPNFEYCTTKAYNSSLTAGMREVALAACTYKREFYATINVNEAVEPQANGCYSEIRYSICLDGESEVEVYDKKKKKKLKKKLKDITYDDLILCWDFNKGEYKYDKPLWIMKPHEVNEYIKLTFSDGSILNVMGDHRIYNLDENKFTSCLKAKESPIGMRTINAEGEVITLTKREIIHEKNVAYNVIINKHINMYANGLLTSRGLNNLYPIKDMKFVKEEREVFTREELSEIPDEYFYGLNLGETPRTFMGDEERTKAQLLLFIERTINTKK